MITLSRNIFILLWTFMIIMLLNIINNKIVFSYFIRNQQQQQHRQSHYKSISFSIFNPFSTSTSTSSTAKQMFFSSLWRQIKQSNEKGRNSLIDADTPTYTAKKGNRYQEKVAVWTKETIADIVKESFALFNPPIRQFLRIKNEISKTSTLFNEITSTASVSISSKLSIVDTIRILQLNMLADGLSGLRDDLGAFSRISVVDMIWDNRKLALLKEVLQYNPDIITLQECDHFYDWFLPILTEQGYEGIFAPKPASACLEVSDNSDGCAIFVRRSKFQVKSVEVSKY